MKKYLVALAFVAFVVLALPAKAETLYVELSPGYLLKQSQEKSALEYRLRSLEAQINGDPQMMILQIESRIDELKRQRDDEKEYIRGVYGNNGIGNQLEFKLPEIDAKYQSQINALEGQKSSYNSQIKAEEKRQNDIAEIKRQLKEIDRKADQEIKKVKDDLEVKNQNALDAYIPDGTTPYSGRIPTAQEAFDYLDSLSLHDASEAYQKLNSINPELATQTIELYNRKYPNGKAGTAMNDEYRENIKPIVQTSPNTKNIKELKPTLKETSDTKKAFFDDISIPILSTTTSEIKVELPPVAPQEKFVDKVFNFFKRLKFW